MSSYRIVEHQVPCQHLREYSRALAYSEEDVLHLSVKQYIPIDDPQPQPGDITIIGAHANGFHKELYEPLWEDLITQSKKYGFRIRSIWMADDAQQGASGVLNENKLGNDPGWFDHSRDLLHLINMKRDEMPRPLIGVGHSKGGAQLCNLAFFHPTLFTSLILLDPVIQPHTAEASPKGPPSVARLSTFRRDLWPSREAAQKAFREQAFYKTWDSRVLDRWIQHGLRDVPTPHYPDQQKPSVTLMTPISHEVFTFLRPNYDGYGANGKPVNRKTHADVDPSRPIVSPFYRYESQYVLHHLPELRPSVFYIFARLSTTSNDEWNELKLTLSGRGVGGSGGVKEGRVDSYMFEDVGHLIPMETPDRTAEQMAKWLEKEMGIWKKDWEDRERTWVKGKSLQEKQAVDDRWKKEIGGPLKRKPKQSKI